jgi:hypothetical protein
LQAPSYSARMPASSKSLSCLECTDDEGKCRTKSWEIAFTRALFQTVRPTLSASPSDDLDPTNSEVREEDSSNLSLFDSGEHQASVQQMTSLPDDGESNRSIERQSPMNGNAALDANSGRSHSIGEFKVAGDENNRPCVGMECEKCHEWSLVMYPVDGKSLVCCSCSKGRRMRSNRR